MTPPPAPAAVKKPLSQLWKRWGLLTPADRRDTLRAALLLPSIKRRLARQSVRDVLAWIAAAPLGAPPSNPDDVAWTAVHATGRAAAYGVVRGNCLSRSLTLLRLLAERGVQAELCLGTRMASGAVVAHAWVERSGVALNDPRGFASRFTRLPGPISSHNMPDSLTKDAFR